VPEVRWIDLIDPSADEIKTHLPAHIHPTALDLLLAPHVHDDEPRPRIESHGDYVLGVMLVVVAVKSEDRVYYQEVDFVLTADQIVTVSKTPPDEAPYDPKSVKEMCKPEEHVGMYAFRLIDDISERYLDLIDDLNDEIDELEDKVEEWPPAKVRGRVSDLRHDMLRIRRTLAPTRDAVRKIVDGRIELEGGGELFPREVQIHFSDAYDKLLRASDGLETSRDLVAGVRDYSQSKIANDQNEVMKRFTVIASVLLLPTFIVGLYGQNFHDIPEIGWHWGYWWSWGLIIGTTIGQLVFYRWKKWV
jgi:magnesium transporter